MFFFLGGGVLYSLLRTVSNKGGTPQCINFALNPLGPAAAQRPIQLAGTFGAGESGRRALLRTGLGFRVRV